MDTMVAKEAMARFLAVQDAPTLAKVLLELAEDFAPVYERLERLRLRDDPVELCAGFKWQLQQWESDDRFVGYRDAAKFGRDLDTWVSQVEREVLPVSRARRWRCSPHSSRWTAWCSSVSTMMADTSVEPSS